MAASRSVIPGWDQLDFARDCSAYGQWLAAFIAPNPWTPEEALGGSIPLSIVLMSYALPPGWVFNDTSVDGGVALNMTEVVHSSAGTPYFSSVMQWFVAHLYTTYNTTDGQWYADDEFVDHVVWEPANRCGREFCKAIAFTSNADLSGIGIIIAYYIEASVTTLYLILFSGWRIRKHLAHKAKRRKRALTDVGELQERGTVGTPIRTRGRLWRARHRLFDALRGAFDSFFMAAAVLAIAILTAVIVMETSHIHENHRRPINAQNIPTGHALYDSALGLLVGLYATFPVVVLYSVWPQESELADEGGQLQTQYTKHIQQLPTGDFVSICAAPLPPEHKPRRGRRTWLRRGVLVVLWGLAAAIVFLDPRSELDDAYRGKIPDDDGTDSDTFAVVLYACDQRGGRPYWQVLQALQYLVIGVPALWLLLTGLIYYTTGRLSRGNKLAANRQASDRRTKYVRDEGGPYALQRLGRPVWRHAVAWAAAAIMWVILVCLTELRTNIIIVAGGLDKGDDWEVGQVLAIAAWGPPAVDFMFLLMFGIEAGLGGRLPYDFIIRHVSSTTHLGKPGNSPEARSEDCKVGDSSENASKEESLPAQSHAASRMQPRAASTGQSATAT
ncbi:hypothetical protein SEPCBS57363_003487 [Sporothrix epigloea]|uniref:Uncharacterized protein n=1 Tax=Sporothrix epigloea TaxID=1892477 RepID=A0ABP0DLY6_9PEZI